MKIRRIQMLMHTNGKSGYYNEYVSLRREGFYFLVSVVYGHFGLFGKPSGIMQKVVSIRLFFTSRYGIILVKLMDFRMEKKIDEARKHLEKAVELDPKDVRSWQYLGSFFLLYI